MTTCDDSTRRALIEAIGDYSQASWAKRNCPPDMKQPSFTALVNNVLLRKGVSEHRENLLRAILGLEPVARTPVILRSTERVVKRPGYGKPRGYVEFKIRVSPEEAEEIRRAYTYLGYRSFSEWWNRTYQRSDLV
jgi:hypothetical protein